MTKEMTRVEFQEIVNEISGRVHVSGRGKNTKWADCEILEMEWLTGGVDGGNCWGDEPNHPVYADPMPEFDDLDNLLIKVVPDMGFLHYKKLTQLIKDDERHQGEYYGNSYIYAIKRINVEDIWRFLCEHEFIEEIGGKKLYYCERYKNPTAKRRAREFVIATSQNKAQQQVGSRCPDGWFGSAELYDSTNNVMVRLFSKLTKAQQQSYKDICANAR